MHGHGTRSSSRNRDRDDVGEVPPGPARALPAAKRSRRGTGGAASDAEDALPPAAPPRAAVPGRRLAATGTVGGASDNAPPPRPSPSPPVRPPSRCARFSPSVDERAPLPRPSSPIPRPLPSPPLPPPPRADERAPQPPPPSPSPPPLPPPSPSPLPLQPSPAATHGAEPPLVSPRAAVFPVSIPAYNPHATSATALWHVPKSASGLRTTHFSPAELIEVLNDSGMTHPRNDRDFSPHEVMLALNLKCPISQGLVRCVRASTCDLTSVLCLFYDMSPLLLVQATRAL